MIEGSEDEVGEPDLKKVAGWHEQVVSDPSCDWSFVTNPGFSLVDTDARMSLLAVNGCGGSEERLSSTSAPSCSVPEKLNAGSDVKSHNKLESGASYCLVLLEIILIHDEPIRSITVMSLV